MSKFHLNRPSYYILEALTVLLIAFISLKLWAYNLIVPFHYSGDSVVMLMYIKGLIQNGWTLVIPQLSAPYSMSAAAFPLATSFDWGVMKLISLFTSEVGLILNTFWLLTLVFTAWTATFAMRSLELNRWTSFVGGVLYAFLPFALMRNVGHLNLVYYTVPLLALLAIHIARGNNPKNENENDSRIRHIGYIACIVQGFNYIYFSFFAVALLSFSALVGHAKGTKSNSIKTAKIAISIVLISASLNLTPSFISWYQHGKPPEMSYKSRAEAEIYGAKLRRMITPHPDNPVYIFSKWGKRDRSANFPNENENVTVRLGLYASAGLLFLLAVSLTLVRVNSPLIKTTSVLSLFTLLVITVGGLGAVFNLLTVPDIRAYNRFSVFLAFFSILGASWWFNTKFKNFASSKKEIVFATLAGGFILLSLYDQLLDIRGMAGTQQADMQSAYHEREFVSKLESLYPHESNIFQLPVTGFPPLSTHERMQSYDHLKPYLWSTHLNWSWPSFSQRHRSWQDNVSKLDNKSLLRSLALSGFSLIWVDRYAYKDNGETLIRGLVDSGAKVVLAGESVRYAVLDIDQVIRELKSSLGTVNFHKESDSIINDVLVKWEKGFYPVEKRPDGAKFRWSKSNSRVAINNPGEQPRNIIFSFEIQSQASGIVTASNSQVSNTINSSPSSTLVKFEFTIAPMKTETIYFSTDLHKVVAPGDPREMYFSVISPTVESGPI